ncbi:MAG: triple tyrosine motif-containing protein, partial [Flavobacteriaceae bacterium]
KAEEIQNEPAWGVGSSLVTYNNDILYTTNNGVFKYDFDQHKFSNDSLLTSRFFPDGDHIIGILISEHKANRLWGFTNKNVVYVSPGKLNDQPQATRIPTPTFFRRNLGVSGFEFITHLQNELYLIGISNGYITLDLDKLKTKEYEVNLNAISKEYHDARIEEVSIKDNTEFKYSENNLNFSFSVPEFDKYTDVNYQYQLTGLYDEWGSWSSTPEVSFKNLRYGDYSFRVRAKIGNTLSKNVASYQFVIGRPWYLSNLALLSYGLAVILLSILIHKLYKAYFRKQQLLLLKENEKKLKRKKLKAQKKIIQIKNEKLKQEIDSKNRELAISTMSIIKKNEFLNAIKDQLREYSDQAGVKSVIRTIDRNINNADDWKFFEDAFNNADKDFLQKVKNQHPELTSNDLKLCAYLRLNLSSKEIAPLLNISVRSLEVKRYRLRKKMQLPRDSGLTEYILQL